MICLLAGGRGQRMERLEQGNIDKALLPIGKYNILDYLINQLDLHQYHWVINANDHNQQSAQQRFGSYDVPIINDIRQGYHGPLMGILTALNYNKNLAQPYDYIIFIPSDTPLIPKNYMTNMIECGQSNNADIIMAESHNRTHPTLSLWHQHLYDDLKHAVLHENMRKVDKFTAKYRQFICTFADVKVNNRLIDTFFNINTIQDYQIIQRVFHDEY